MNSVVAEKKPQNQTVSIETNFFSTMSFMLITFGDGELPYRQKAILAAAITEFGVAVAEVLAAVKKNLSISDTEAVLTLPLHPEKSRTDAEEMAQRDNSYHLFKVEQRQEGYFVSFKIARMITEEGKKPKLEQTPAKFLQGLLRSWLRAPLARLPKALAAGVYQKAAEQVNSFVALSFAGDGAGQKPSFPDIEERRPEVRAENRKEALAALCARMEPLEYAKKRDLKPGEYADDDPEGDRTVCVTQEWIDFSKNPFPGRLPSCFVNQASANPVRLFSRREEKTVRGKKKVVTSIYAFLPLLTAEEGILATCKGAKTDWWHSKEKEFRALPHSQGKWPKAGTGIMLRLGLDSKNGRGKKWMENHLYSSSGIGTVNLKEIISPHPGRKGASGKKLRKPGAPLQEWKLDIALRFDAVINAHERILAVHLGKEPVVYWKNSETGEDGSIDEWSLRINRALADQENLVKAQRKFRSVARRRFFQKNKAWTRGLAHVLVALAKEQDASLVVEEISWVDKMGGDAPANRRFSMWNYSDLTREIEHQGEKNGVFVGSILDFSVKKELAKAAGKEKDKDWYKVYGEAEPQEILDQLTTLAAVMASRRIKGISERQQKKTQEDREKE